MWQDKMFIVKKNATTSPKGPNVVIDIGYNMLLVRKYRVKLMF